MDIQQNPDLTLGVEFFMHSVHHPRKSKEAGRPIYEDREYVRIRYPGDNKKEHVAPASEMHYVPHAKQQMTYADRFQASYEAFAKGRADFVAGTPLVRAGIVSDAQIKELQSQNIVTVEQLAGLQDRLIAKLGVGWRQYVEAARSYLEASKGVADVEALKSEIAALKAQLAVTKTDSPTTGDQSAQFADFSREDLFAMATDAGLNPRANATQESLVKMLAEASEKKAREAA